VLLTCTFNLAAPRLEERLGPAPVEELATRAVALARRAGTAIRIAGDLGPTGLFGPRLPPPDLACAAARYTRAAAALAAAGADLLWLESQWDLGEALLALAAARRTGLPAVITFTLREAGAGFEAPDGTPAERLLVAAERDGAAAVGVNCVRAGTALAELTRRARALLRVPLVAKPSPGLPGAVASPEAFAEALRPALAAGLAAAGGCCGATADHLRALAAVLTAHA
jgi:5-methyltetrahydrofolate--homocysteine methyltransferase